MFKNMTERERKLGLAVLCLVPAFLLFYVFMNYSSKYSTNQKEIIQIKTQLEQQEDLQLSALNAVRRREYYDLYSLPNDLNTTKIQYEGYLKQLTKECELAIDVFNPRNSGKNEISYLGSNGRTKVFEQISYTLSGKGNLEQITAFLHRFYSLNMVQRISQITIDPIMVGGGGEKEFERAGPHKITMNVEVISMVSAQPSREFENDYQTLKKSLDEYNMAILSRNMFGPANNAPQLSSGMKKTISESSDSISYQISATDKDKNDKLKFELLSTEIKDAKLVQVNPDSPRATFSCESLPPGDYKFRVLVTDNGYPNKSTEQECILTIREKAAVVVTEPEDPVEEPAVRFAGATEINGVWGVGDEQKVGIWIRPTDENLVCQVGSTFKLDELEWKITKIDVREIEIECNGEILTYNIKGVFKMLDSPLKRRKAILPAGAALEIETPSPVVKSSSKNN